MIDLCAKQPPHIAELASRQKATCLRGKLPAKRHGAFNEGSECNAAAPVVTYIGRIEGIALPPTQPHALAPQRMFLTAARLRLGWDCWSTAGKGT